MKKNEVLSLRAERLGAELEGICHHEGMAVFVPGLLPGEEALTRIVKVEKRYAFGKMEAAPAIPSPDRQTPDCPAFPRCGGCTGRHMTYTATLAAKRQQVADCFARIAGLQVETEPVLGMEHPYACRNKTAMPVTERNGEPAFGFFAARSHAVVPVTACPNAMAPTDRIAAAVLQWMKENRLSCYNEESGKGLVRHLVARVNRAGESMVTLAVNSSRLPHSEALREALKPLGVVSIWWNENRTKTNVIFSDRFHHIYGRNTLEDRLCGLTFALSPASFFQVNPEQTEKLYATALAFADPRPEDTVCDVYCGAGTISLMMAGHCRRVTGIEVVEAAVENARLNAERNGIGNAVFHAGKAEEVLPQLVAAGMRPEIIVVDPPRKGLEPPVIEALITAGPRRLVYVSCNPATLARDVGLLCAGGYAVQKVQPVDMFCWTSGVETVCLLSKG